MAIVQQEALLQATGYKQLGSLERWLRNNRIRFYIGKGGHIWTTEHALEAGLHLVERSDEEDEIEFR